MEGAGNTFSVFGLGGVVGGGVVSLNVLSIAYSTFTHVFVLVCSISVRMFNLNLKSLSGQLELSRNILLALSNVIIYTGNVYYNNKLKFMLSATPAGSGSETLKTRILVLACFSLFVIDSFLRPPSDSLHFLGQAAFYWSLLQKVLYTGLFINVISRVTSAFQLLKIDIFGSSIVNLYEELTTLCSVVNQSFSIQLNLVLGGIFFIITSNSYFVLKHCFAARMRDDVALFNDLLVINLSWIVIQFFELFAIVHTINRLLFTSEEFIDRFYYGLLARKEDVSTNDKSKMQRLLHSESTSMSPFGFYTVNNSLVSTVMSAYVTYLLVLVQFGLVTINGHKYLKGYFNESIPYMYGPMYGPAPPMYGPAPPMYGPAPSTNDSAFPNFTNSSELPWYSSQETALIDLTFALNDSEIV